MFGNPIRVPLTSRVLLGQDLYTEAKKKIQTLAFHTDIRTCYEIDSLQVAFVKGCNWSFGQVIISTSNNEIFFLANIDEVPP